MAKSSYPKVLLLCGGKGERLRPVTESIPKPLVEIKGKPILSYILNYFVAYGFREFIIAVGYQKEKIIDYVKKHFSNLEIEFVDSGDVDILKRIQDGAELIKDDFIMCYGDTLADVDLDHLLSFHQERSNIATITSYPMDCQFGVLEIAKDGTVQSFTEKPVLDLWINIGYCYFEKSCIPEFQKHKSFVECLQSFVMQGFLNSYQHRRTHITVNTLKELQDAEDNIHKFTSALDFKTSAGQSVRFLEAG